MGIKVISCFDGISCGMVALERAGIKADRYVAYEIDKYAIEISKKNHKNIEHCGNVKNADFSQYKGFDLLIGGSPCQDLSCAGTGKGLSGEKSGLFFEYLRALKEVNPKYFLLENNNSMTAENKNIISSYIGCVPIMINSNLLSAQDRKRLYWSNIKISQPTDLKLYLKDIVENEENKKAYDITERMNKKEKGTLSYKKTWSNVRTLNQKSRCLTTCQNINNSGSTNIKYDDNKFYKPTPLESERLQTLPDNYTLGFSDTQRYKALGNGWTVDVIAHILRGLND